MYTEIVTATVMFGCLLCIIHSWQYRGLWPTVGFFTGGFVFGIVRENIVALLPSLYTYQGHAIMIGAAPLMMGFGWSASFYACWTVSERLLQVFAQQWTSSLWTTPLLTAIVTATLALPVETAATAPQTSWWIWPPGAITVLWEMPAIVPFGWAGAAFLFVLLFNWLDKRYETQPLEGALIFVLLTLVIIVLHLLYVLAVRMLIVLIVG